MHNVVACSEHEYKRSGTGHDVTISSVETPPASFANESRYQRALAACPQVDTIFQRATHEGHMPGVSFGVLVDAELIYEGATGTLNIDSERPPDGDSIFRIASMTKSFAAAALLTLRDRGQLSLDDHIETYVPQLAHLCYPSTDSPPITIRDLLTMSAGWPQDDPWADRQLYRTDSAVDDLYGEGISFSNPPGVKFEYSNYGYIALGAIINAASGEGAMDYITRTLLKPLNMTSTVWERDRMKSANLAQGYRWEDGQWREEQPLTNAGDVATFAGLYSSVKDLARWVGLFQSAWPANDEPQNAPLSRASLREMQRIWQSCDPSLAVERIGARLELSAGGYGYGLSMTHNGVFRTAGHGGGLPGFGSHMRWAPDYGVGVVALANVTYANVHDACDDALDELICSAGTPARSIVTSKVLARAHDDICRLLNVWDEELAATVFADNFFLDCGASHWKARFDKLRAAHGSFDADSAIEAENWLRGQRRVRAKHGCCQVWVSLSPTVPAKIQALRLRSILPPSPALRDAATSLAELTAKPRRGALNKLLGPGSNRDQVWTQLRLVHLSYGACRVDAVSGGNGASWSTFALHSQRQELELELRVNATGKLTQVNFVPKF
jgi:CubicO group peptidase (beta-lactamase class C family)